MTHTAFILPVMAGTTGHVDHGKTSLVRNLTGFDTDRLREEKERGMSIDLGVAPCRLPGGGIIGIIDVPGHLDFIRNMVAGASSLDILMLVIAADDGVMPQTREHLNIARLLGATKVMVTLTKIDLVDLEMRGLVLEEVSDFMKVQGFPDAPVVEVSNETGAGMEGVLLTLEKLALNVDRTPDARAFRMDIRQGFPVKGYGTVVTGVPVSGCVRVGEDLELWPRGLCVGLRGVQNYREGTDGAKARTSTALNLRDVAAEDIRRGMTLAAPGIYRPSPSAIVYLRNSSEKFVLRRAMELIFHCGTAAIPASCKLIDKTELTPGESAFAQLRFSASTVVAAGDRFILRRPSPSITLGGGVILSARDYRFRKTDPYFLERLQLALDSVEGQDYFLCELLAGPDALWRGEDLHRLTCRLPAEAEQLLREKELQGELQYLGGGGWLAASRAGEVALIAQSNLRRYHRLHPYTWGMEPGLFCRLLGVDPGNFEKLFSILSADGGMVLRHGRLALADFNPAIDADGLINFRERILDRLQAASPNWVARGNLLKDLGSGSAGLKIVLKLLQEEGVVLALGSNYLLMEAYENCRAILLDLFLGSTGVALGAFREAAGLPRNTAVAILESFDSEGLTRREGDARVLVKRRRTAPGGVHGLQNRCGTARSQVGSIPIRLRHLK